MDFVFICLNILRSMIREEVDYQIDLSFVGMVDKTGFFKSVFGPLGPKTLRGQKMFVL